MIKKGVFFSIDALIAVSMLLLAGLIIFPVIKYSYHESYIQSDLMKVLSTLKVGEINNSYVKSMISDGKIKDLNKSLLEQIGEFYVQNASMAKEFANNTLSNLDFKDNIGIWYGNKLIFSKNTSSYENSKQIDSETQVITGINEGENITGFSARAYLSSDVQTKYYYFGGYVGEGNISINLSYNGNATDIYLEIAVNKDFDVKINGNSAGYYTNSSSEFIPANYSLSAYRSYLNSGDNIIELIGDKLFIAGGYFRFTLINSTFYEEKTKYQFPGLKGIMNIYDGFYVPGNISEMELLLHYNSSQEIFLNIGNITVYNGSSIGDSIVKINNSELDSLLDYDFLSYNTIPLRLGLKEIEGGGQGGNADVILITDLSSSMANRLDSDNGGTARNCNEALLLDSSTQRISLAKCLDINFTSTVLSGPGNRMGLVSFSTNADNYVNLTRNQTLLNNTIIGYSSNGYTCISCAINRAYQILNWHSNSSRKKFIVVMSDGLPNRRSTTICNDIYSVGMFNSNESIFGGQNGISSRRSNGIWEYENSGTTNQINDIDFFNSTLGFGVGNSGTIIKWDGISWSTIASPSANNLYGIDFLNESFALGVGANGDVIKWDGTSWALLTTISNSPTLYSISIYNYSHIYISGVRSNDGRIYKSIDKGVSWSELYSINNIDLRGIKIINSTTGYSVGEGGHTIKIDRGSFSDISSPTTQELYSINSYNSTVIYAVGGNSGSIRIIRSTGGSFTSTLSISTDVDSLRDIINYNNTFYAVGESSTIFENNGSGWSRNYDIKIAYQGNLTSGLDCSDDASCTDTKSIPSLNANYSSCRAKKELNSTIYSIGFGPVVTCTLGNTTLKSIAECGNGSYYASTDGNSLQNFYLQIAYDIFKVSYSNQSSSVSGGIYSILYPDSYIYFNFSKSITPYGLVTTFEKKFTDSYNASFGIPINSSVLETKVVSYSGPRWTENVFINNIIAYNLSKYNLAYAHLGDPYCITIPKNLVSLNNNITLTTAINPGNSSEGSSYNKVLYTILRNITSYNSSALFSSANGCKWEIEFEDGSISSINIPEDYNGADMCYYKTGQIEYKTFDAVQVAVLKLLELLDVDSNQKIDLKISQNNFKITTIQINGLPYTWWTDVQIRRWE